LLALGLWLAPVRWLVLIFAPFVATWCVLRAAQSELRKASCGLQACESADLMRFVACKTEVLFTILL
jgi:hypothetical protein